MFLVIRENNNNKCQKKSILRQNPSRNNRQKESTHLQKKIQKLSAHTDCHSKTESFSKTSNHCEGAHTVCKCLTSSDDNTSLNVNTQHVVELWNSVGAHYTSAQ